jgi:cystathionine gamma-synthase
LPSSPDFEIAQRQMKGFGGVVSFTLRADSEQTGRFIDRLQIPFISPSLGGAESLVNQPALMSYYSLTVEERAAVGIKENLVRYALGLEDSQDIIADLQEAFQFLKKLIKRGNKRDG